MDSGFDVYQRAVVEAAAVAALSPHELWLRYLALAGTADAWEVEGYLCGLLTMTCLEHNILAEAVNERLEELGHRPAAPYRLH